jgi:hypothetical protein
MTHSPEESNDEIGALANAIRELHHRGDRGALAELRRMDTAGPPVSGALHQLLARRYPGRLDEARARRLALFIRILALAGAADGLKDGPRLLGRRMEEIGVSPARVERLLAARGPAFDDQVLLLARRLANAGPLPFREIGQLVLGDAGAVERTRYDIARGYWTTVSAASPQTLSGDQQ